MPPTLSLLIWGDSIVACARAGLIIGLPWARLLGTLLSLVQPPVDLLVERLATAYHE